jgi:hypothetical protein
MDKKKDKKEKPKDTGIISINSSDRTVQFHKATTAPFDTYGIPASIVSGSEFSTPASNDAMYLSEDFNRAEHAQGLFDRLRNSRDPIESQTADLIQSRFPNYEVFWRNYLEPLRGEDIGRNWRYDTLHNLEELGISQFGILKSVNLIRISRPYITVGDPLQHYKNIYFHFGLVFDSVTNFARNLLIVEEFLGLTNLNRTLRLSNDELVARFSKWVIKKYKASYDNMISLGKPIFYYPHYDIDYLGLLIPDPLRKNYIKFITLIKNYRNFYIHTPGVDITIKYPARTLHAVKKEYVNEYRHWSKIQKHIIDYPERFDDPKTIVENDLKMTLEYCNFIWIHFIEHMDTITKHSDYNRIFRNFDREKESKRP